MQSVTDWELIVVDDGSIDSGPDIVKRLSDPRITLIQQKNQGVSSARNRGYRSASCDLIAFLDADDEWHPTFIEEILKLHDDYPTAGWFATQYVVNHPIEGRFINRLNGLPKDYRRGILKDYFLVAAKSDPPVHSSAVAIKKKSLESVGGFPVGIQSGEDLLTWANLAIQYDLAYLCQPLSIFHVSGINRMPDPDRIVALKLEDLVRKNNLISGLKQYLSFWYKLQSRVAISAGDKKLATRFIFHSLQHNPTDLKIYYFMLILLIPLKYGVKIDKLIRSHTKI